METSNMKNMVILKKLPSNLVEEAIIILKSGAKVKQPEKATEKTTGETGKKAEAKEKDYVLKEAEMLVSSYISKIENEGKQKVDKTIKLNKNYKRLKLYAFISSLMVVVQAIGLMFK